MVSSRGTDLPKSRVKPLGFCKDNMLVVDKGDGPQHVSHPLDDRETKRKKDRCDLEVVRPF